MLPAITAHATGHRLFVDTGVLSINDSLVDRRLGDTSVAVFAGAEFDWDWNYQMGGGVIKGAWVVGFTAEPWRDDQQTGLMYSGGVTPVLRWELSVPLTFEAGVGVHLVGGRPPRKLSTAAEFSDILGVYYRYSSDFQFGYRFMHFSNAGLKQPNMGVNFHFFHIGVAF